MKKIWITLFATLFPFMLFIMFVRYGNGHDSWSFGDTLVYIRSTFSLQLDKFLEDLSVIASSFENLSWDFPSLADLSFWEATLEVLKYIGSFVSNIGLVIYFVVQFIVLFFGNLFKILLNFLRIIMFILGFSWLT